MELEVKLESMRIEALVQGVQSTCFNRCVETIHRNELTVDEVHCLDRCSWKYLSAHKMYENILSKVGGPQEKRKK